MSALFRSHSIQTYIRTFGYIIVTIPRLIMSLTLHMYYQSAETFDDQLLMSYTYSDVFDKVDRFRLSKNLGYSIWLFLVNKTNIPVDVAQFIMWVIAAVLVSFAFQRIFKKSWFSFFVYTVVIWNPLAFENWLGTRVYRNSLFPPVFFILLALLLLFAFNFKTHKQTPVQSVCSPDKIVQPSSTDLKIAEKHSTFTIVNFSLLSLLLGSFIFFTYILKEDMAWILPMCMVVIFGKVISYFFSGISLKKKLIMSAICLLPIISFGGLYQGYKTLNQHYFGVGLLNTRTQGELAEFVNKIYEIKNSDQNTTIWAPASSIEAAWEASPTLSENQKMLYDIEHVIFAAPNIHVSPLKGDFLTWQLRIAISDTLGWDNEAKIQKYFSRVNDELDIAFKNGVLERTSKITLAPSLVPRTKDEIAQLIPKTVKLFSLNFWSQGVYVPTENHNDIETTTGTENEKGLTRLNIDVTDPNPVYFRYFSFDKATRIATDLNTLYSYAKIALTLLLIVTTIISLKHLKKRSNKLLVMLIAWALLAYAFVYCFAVAWFSEFLDSTYVSYFYAVGCTSPFISISLLLGVGISLQLLNEKSYKKAVV